MSQIVQQTNKTLENLDEHAEGVIERLLSRFRVELSAAIGAGQNHDIFQMRQFGSTKIIDNLTELQIAMKSFTKPAELAFKALPPIAGATVAVLALRVPTVLNGMGSAAIDEVLKSNTAPARAVLILSFIGTYHYWKRLAATEFSNLMNLEEKEIPRHVATSVRRLPLAFWLSTIVSGSLALHGIKLLGRELFRRFLALSPRHAAYPVAFVAGGLVVLAGTKQRSNQSRPALVRRSTTSVLDDVKENSSDGKHFPSLKEFYLKTYQKHAATLVPISVALGVVPPTAIAAGVALTARSLVTINSLSESFMDDLLRSTTPVGRVTLALCTIPGWVAAVRHRGEMYRHMQLMSKSAASQDEAGLREVIHGVRNLSPRFWVAVGLSGALALQMGRNTGIRAMQRYLKQPTRVPAVVALLGTGVVANRISTVLSSSFENTHQTFANEASSFMQRLGDRLTPLVLALAEMQPAAVVTACFLGLRLLLTLNGFAEIAVNEIIHLNAAAARWALTASTLPALFAARRYRIALSSPTGPEDLASRASQVGVSTWLMVFSSGFVTLQATKHFGSAGVRRAVKVEGRTLLALFVIRCLLRKRSED